MIKKRDGHEVPYDREKIKAAVEKAVKAAGEIAPLDTVVDDIESLDRGVAALHRDSHVQEAIVALKAPRLALNDAGARRHES